MWLKEEANAVPIFHSVPLEPEVLSGEVLLWTHSCRNKQNLSSEQWSHLMVTENWPQTYYMLRSLILVMIPWSGSYDPLPNSQFPLHIIPVVQQKDQVLERPGDLPEFPGWGRGWVSDSPPISISWSQIRGQEEEEGEAMWGEGGPVWFCPLPGDTPGTPPGLTRQGLPHNKWGQENRVSKEVRGQARTWTRWLTLAPKRSSLSFCSWWWQRTWSQVSSEQVTPGPHLRLTNPGPPLHHTTNEQFLVSCCQETQDPRFPTGITLKA